tara:strand:- start:65 stop:313 length:249 start_codon:yes stop_codon:yes gene_type:complete
MQSLYNDAFEKEIDDYLASLEMIAEAAMIDDVKEIERRLELEEYFIALDNKGGSEMSRKEIRAAALKRLKEQFETFGSEFPL